MRVIPERLGSQLTSERVLTLTSPEFSCAPALPALDAVNAAWWSASDPLAYPFRLSRAAVVKRLGWVNSSSAGGGVDLGIYSASWARLVSVGTTTASGASAWQWTDVTDTPLNANTLYYLVYVRDNTTANRVIRYGNTFTGAASLLGTFETTTNSYPLPDPLADMVLSVTGGSMYFVGIKLQEIDF